MVQISELPVNLANQIAAGEVIERPASVVKELVENAIDAGSKQIQIDFVDAGLKKITVQDNGSGIPSDQLDLAFTRHATSKIKNERDLFNVGTLGFRGEALASIAAVSHVEILTDSAGQVGQRAEFSAGVKQLQEKAGAAVGTRITVRDLFYNTPARLKYLRSPRTEIMKIVDIINRLALGYPHIAFTLKNEGRILLKTVGNGNLKQTAANIYGRNIAEKMISLDDADQDFEITGLISKPEITRSTRNFISILLNGRYINNFQIVKAVLAGYGNNLTDKHYPFAIIKIKVDPLLVDVNVHPTKREVRLSKETQLCRLITKTISQKLMLSDVQASGSGNLISKKAATLVDQLKFNLNKNVVETKRETATIDEVNESQPLEVRHDEAIQYVDLNVPREDDYYVITTTWLKNVARQKQLSPFPSKNKAATVISIGDEVLLNNLPELKFVGQTGAYIIAENNDNLYLIDQVAARRLILFTKIKQELTDQNVNQQELLSPLVLEFSSLDFIQIKSKLKQIKEIGLYLEEFGQNTFILRSYPTWLKEDVEGQVRLILDEYLNVDQNDTTKLITRIAGKQAQRQITGRQKLTVTECNAILTALGKTKDPYHDAQGNVVIICWHKSELRKMFKKDN